MAKSKAELLAEKMAAQRVGQSAFEAGKAPVVEMPQAEPQEEEKVEEAVPVVEEPKQEEVKPAQEKQEPAKPKKTTKKVAKSPAKKEEKVEEEPGITPPSYVLDRVQRRKKVPKKTNAYYLSVANIEALAKAAAEADTVPSTLLDEILTSVLSSWTK